MERRFGVPLERRHGEVEGRAESEQGVKHRDEHREEVLEEDKENDEAQDAELTKVEDPRRSSKKEVKKRALRKRTHATPQLSSLRETTRSLMRSSGRGGTAGSPRVSSGLLFSWWCDRLFWW